MNYDLVGIGLGPFNLSLAALASENTQLKACFLDAKPEFKWHGEIQFDDAVMQTSFLKDLVTSVNPTNKYSFLNYLVTHGLFHSFMNTNRTSITRVEFEQYCRWVSKGLGDKCQFYQKIDKVDFDKNQKLFTIKSQDKSYTSTHLSIATGPVPFVPSFALPHLGDQVFHPKMRSLEKNQFQSKRVLVVGGGQTGVEIFRNTLNNHFGVFDELKLISSRSNLEPLESSPFVNEYFTPHYTNRFYHIHPDQKPGYLKEQKMASDGNTPEYLDLLYNDLYQIKLVHRDPRTINLYASQRLTKIERTSQGLRCHVWDDFEQKETFHETDIVVLATGFQTKLPPFMEALVPDFQLNEKNEFIIQKDFSLNWTYQSTNKIFVQNLSRSQHGIADPQLSLAAWRSATILNSLTKEEVFALNSYQAPFIQFGSTPW